MGYGPQGDLVSATDLAGNAWSYSEPSDATFVVTSPGGEALEIESDDSGNPVRIGYPGGGEITMTYEYILNAPSLGDGLDSPHLITEQGTGVTIVRYIYQGEHPLLRIGSSGLPQYYLEDAMGSVIAIADSSGSLSASIEYDSFGVVLNGDTLPANTAGDFRFHGMWKDPSGLYHVRARQYDANVGRFLSRDAAEGNELAPETWHPYQFAFSNPHVFRDPTGLVSLTDLQAAFSIQNILKAIPRAVLNRVKDEVIGRLTGFVVERVLEGVFPGLIGPPTNFRGFGDFFENIVADVGCGLLSGINGKEWLHREVPVADSGKSGGNGYGCGQPFDPGSLDDHSNPDFLISVAKPTKLGGGNRSFRIADAKFQLKFKKKGVVTQLKRMSSQSKNYSWADTVMYFVALPVSKKWVAKVKDIATRNGARLEILSSKGFQK